VQKQMEFWPNPKEQQQTQEIWGTLNQQQQKKNHNRSIPSCQQVCLPGENKSNQGGKL